MTDSEDLAPNGDAWEVYGLMALAAQRDGQAFSTLWKEHGGQRIAYGLAREELDRWPDDHADAVNEAGERTWKYLPGWLRPEKRCVRWAPWASTESRRAMQNFRRNQRLTLRATREELVDPRGAYDSRSAVVPDIADDATDRMTVRALLAVMTDEDRELLLAKYVDDLSRSEVAELVVGQKLSWVDQHTRSAVLAARMLLEDDGIEVTEAAYRQAHRKARQVVRPSESESDERTSEKPDHGRYARRQRDAR